MNTLWKYIQYGYLLVALILFVEGILVFNQNKERALFMFCFAIFITLIFFLKRRFRKKVQKRNNQQ